MPLIGKGALDNRLSCNGKCYNLSRQPGIQYKYNISSTQPKIHPQGKDAALMHRCIRRHGGHPGLISWDVIEALHDAWRQVGM